MVVRGVYSRAEEAMLGEWRERAHGLVGWCGDPSTGRALGDCDLRVATRELITFMARAYDPRNPLYRDEDYAGSSRWGGVIAPPFYPRLAGEVAHCWLDVTPEVGVFAGMIFGEEWDFFKPVHIGDSLRLWGGLAKIEDWTRPGETEERRFFTRNEGRYVNQRDQTVAVCHRTNLTSILPPGSELSGVFRSGEELNLECRGGVGFKRGEVRLKRSGEWVYTKEEIEAIDRMYAAEERRGSLPRYWEDVVVGEELRPAVKGPVTVWDVVVDFHGCMGNILPNEEYRRLGAFGWTVVDPATNIPHGVIEHHLTTENSELIGVYSTTISIGIIICPIGRCISNWMGDDGFLRKFKWIKLLNTPLGDTVFGRGKVARTYVSDEGEHLVDLEVWLETVRGYVSNVGTATVELLSKEETFR